MILKFKKIIILSSSDRGVVVNNYLKSKYKTKLIRKINEINKINNLKDCLLIISGFSHFIPSKYLDKFNLSINLHGGKLPKYRGASVLNWQIINNEKYIYITSITVNEIIDSGHILKERKILINNKCFDNLIDVINNNFALLALESILILENNMKLQIQKGKPAIWHKRSPIHSEIIPSAMTLSEAILVFRSSSIRYGFPSFFYFDKKKILIKNLKISKMQFKGFPGHVLSNKNLNILIFKDNRSAEYETY